MTASTIPLLLLIAFLWWKTKGDVLSIVLYTSIFDAAAALIVGGSPISPWLFSLAICLPIKLFSGKLHWKPAAGINQGAFLAVALFVLYGAVSSFVGPVVFHGILVSNDRIGNNQPLGWSIGNLAQLLYLLATFAIYLIVIHSTREQLRKAIDWYLYGCVTIGFFSMWELANMVAHVPYPSPILYSNTVHVIFDAYQIGGMWRLNSTLSEASAVAYYLSAGIALLGWRIARTKLEWKSGSAFLLMLLALNLTVSSTAYACMIAMGTAAVFFGTVASLRSGHLSPVKVLIFLLLVAAAVPVLAFTKAPHMIQSIAESVFLNKAQTESYRDRTMLNHLALQTAHDSYFFGAGWGSVRASSFLCSLMGNAGLPGLLLFVAFLVQAAKPLLHPRAYLPYELFEQAAFAIFALLIALLVAAPDICQPILWTLFGIVTVGKQRRPRLVFPTTRARAAAMQQASFANTQAES